MCKPTFIRNECLSENCSHDFEYQVDCKLTTINFDLHVSLNMTITSSSRKQIPPPPPPPHPHPLPTLPIPPTSVPERHVRYGVFLERRENNSLRSRRVGGLLGTHTKHGSVTSPLLPLTPLNTYTL